MSKNGWGSHPLEFDAATAFASLEASVAVRLIATFEPDLIYCEEDDLDLRSVKAINTGRLITCR